MDVSAPLVPPSDLPASCGEGCPFAEELHGAYEDWVWCTRPGALSRTRRVGSSCPGFEQQHATAATAFSTD